MEVSNIRSICNHPWKRELLLQNRIRWNKLWVAIDTIDDTEQAINWYLQLDNFTANSGGYLYIYGVLQALNLQQDAIFNLYYALFEKNIDFKTDYPALYEIRENRNNSIGHPTKRGNDSSFHIIGNASIKKNEFTLASFYPKTAETSKFETINIIDCIKKQNDLVQSILSETMAKLEAEFTEHKNKFKGERLMTNIDNDFHYEFIKLNEHAKSDHPMADMNFKIICNAYEKIKDGIIKRYSSIHALSGIEFTTQRIDYIINRLNRDLITNKINDDLELEIILQSFQINFNELIEMIKEIDREFE